MAALPTVRFSWLDGLGLAAASSPAWIASVAYLATRMSGHDASWSNVLAGPSPANLTRNLLELLYFVAGVAVALIALGAIVFARQQAEEASNSRREAEKVRLSTVYMEIVDRWNAQDLVQSRLKLFALVDEYEALPPTTRSTRAVEDFIRDRIMALKGVDWKMFREYLVLLQFFEDLGMLCWKGYIEKDDIFEFIGQSITTQMSYFGSYIKAARRDNPGSELTLYSNAVYLYKAADAYAPHAHKEEMWDTK